MLKPEIKEKWITALRSGNYKQGYGLLKQIVAGECKYCCIGVLAEINGIENKPLEDNPTVYVFDFSGKDNVSYYGSSEWMELFDRIDKNKKAMTTLSFMNDNKILSFEEIADWIEENL